MTQRRKLLVIDDDPAIFRYLRRGLTHEGYDVAAARVRACSHGSRNGRPTPCCLTSLRRTHVAGPDDQGPVAGAIDRLVAGEDTQGIIAALDAGVDDCIAKPFGLEELAAHIRKVLRRDIWRRGEAPCFSRHRYRSTWCSAASIAAVALIRCRGVSSNC